MLPNCISKYLNKYEGTHIMFTTAFTFFLYLFFVSITMFIFGVIEKPPHTHSCIVYHHVNNKLILLFQKMNSVDLMGEKGEIILDKTFVYFSEQ